MAGLLLFGDTARSAALRHEIPAEFIDDLLFAEIDGKRFVLTWTFERDRVRRARPDAEVLDFFSFGYRDLVKDGMSLLEAEREVVTRAVRQIGIDEALIPGEFPVGLADKLRSSGVGLRIDDDAFEHRRRAKSAAELEGVRAAQRAADAAMGAASELLSAAEPTNHGWLSVENDVLTAEHVRSTLRAVCSARGALCPPDAIVRSAHQGYGHEPGRGPLAAGLPIVIDIWPRDEASACWADMTRTFLVGAPVSEHAAAISERTEVVTRALETARAAIRAGVPAREPFELACEVLEGAGYLTQRTAARPDETEGFQFALGHGVGLEVHEPPLLGLEGRDTLVAGDVIAIEPGLWDEDVGEIRFEDLVLVTESGCETLTNFPYGLTPAG
jgi:Xaa-Pro aminopeptidase